MSSCLACLGSGEVPTKWESVHIDTGDGRPGGYYVGQEPTAFDWCGCEHGQRLKGLEAQREAEETAYLASMANLLFEPDYAGF